MNNNINLLNNYTHLESFLKDCDTLYGENDSVIIIKKRREILKLRLTKNAEFVLNASDWTDTLFTRIISVVLLKSCPPLPSSDTLLIISEQFSKDDFFKMVFVRNYSQIFCSYDK